MQLELNSIVNPKMSIGIPIFDQAENWNLGIKPWYVTEVFVDKENADMALHIIHTLS